MDGRAALIGVLALLATELAAWSIEHDARIRSEPSLVVRRVATLALLAGAALLVSIVLVAAAGVASPSGVAIAAAGVAAAIGAVAVAVRLARA